MKVDSWSRSQIPIRKVKRTLAERSDLISQGSVGSTGSSRRSRGSYSRRSRRGKHKKSDMPKDVQQVIIVEEDAEKGSVISEADSARLEFERKQLEIRRKKQEDEKKDENQAESESETVQKVVGPHTYDEKGNVVKIKAPKLEKLPDFM